MATDQKKIYFMKIARIAAERSKDPVTQVGACIVSQDDKVIGIGYNGFPHRYKDRVKDFAWGKKEALLENKLTFVCHAEQNAILHQNSIDVKNCIIYVTLFPCIECTKMIIQSGIKDVYFLKAKGKEEEEVSKMMFQAAGVNCNKFDPMPDDFEIEFTETN